MRKEKKGLGESQQADTLSILMKKKAALSSPSLGRAGKGGKYIEFNSIQDLKGFSLPHRTLWITMQVMQLVGKMGEGVLRCHQPAPSATNRRTQCLP